LAGASLSINPATAAAGYYGLSIGVAGTDKFHVTAAEGNVYAAGKLSIGSPPSVDAGVDFYGGNTLTASRGNVFVRTSTAQAADVGGQLTLGGWYNDTKTASTSYGGISGRKANSTSGNGGGYLSLMSAASVGGALAEGLRIDELQNTIVKNSATIGGTLGVTGETTLNDTLNLAGDARVYKNEWINLGGLKAPGTSPATYIDLGISGAWEFTDGTDDTVVATIRLPKGMDITVAPTINLGWSSATADPGDDSKQVVWQVEYSYRAEGESLAAAADATLEVTTSASTTANGLKVSELTLATPGATDLLLLLRIKRLGADGDDDLGDDCSLSGCGMKYAINRLGVPL